MLLLDICKLDSVFSIYYAGLAKQEVPAFPSIFLSLGIMQIVNKKSA